MEEIIEKQNKQLPLTDNEANTLLKFICNQIKEKYQITDPNDTDCRVCFDTAREIGIQLLINYNCDVEIINIKELIDIPLTHYINILFLNVNNQIKTYLIDLTYSQFFGKNIILDNRKSISTKNTFKRKEEEQFVKNIRINGYIELNDNIVYEYFNLFLETCKIKDKSKAYQNINKKLRKNILPKSISKKKIKTKNTYKE